MGRRDHLIWAFALVLAGSTLFASKAIFIKFAYAERPDALLLLVWRMIFALPFFLAAGVYAAFRHNGLRRIAARPVRAAQAAAVGFAGYYIAMILDFHGLVYVSAQLERLALFTYPIFVFVLGAMFFGSKLTLGHIASAALTYAGLSFVFLADLETAGGNVPFGMALVIGAAFAFALYQLLARPLIVELGSMLFTSIALASATLATVIHFAIVRGTSLDASPQFLALAAATAIIATVIPSYLVNAGMGRIGAASTAMVSALSPLITIAFAIWLLGERFGLMDACGTLLVLSGVGYHSWRELRATRPQTIESNAS
jgi:drug/metabolite transporter (DMT)-like permease